MNATCVILSERAIQPEREPRYRRVCHVRIHKGTNGYPNVLDP